MNLSAHMRRCPSRVFWRDPTRTNLRPNHNAVLIWYLRAAGLDPAAPFRDVLRSPLFPNMVTFSRSVANEAARRREGGKTERGTKK